MIYFKYLTIIFITSVKFRFEPPGNQKKNEKIFICPYTIQTNLKNQSNL